MDERGRLTQRVFSNQARYLACLRLPEAKGLLAVDLTMPQFKALVLLDAHGSMTAGALARSLGVGLSTMTGIVDRIREQGLVTRGEDPDDRRATRVQLTETGRAGVRRFHEIRREALSPVLERLSIEELELVARATDVLAAAAEGLAGEVCAADQPAEVEASLEARL